MPSSKANALLRDASTLVARGQFEDAQTLLEAPGPLTGGNFGKNWQWVRYQTLLARARIGQRQFAAAEAALDTAWPVADTFGPQSADARDCAQAHVDLYAAWNAAEPGQGHDVNATKWSNRIAGFEAAKGE